MFNLILVIALALIVWALYRFFFVHKIPAIDYSFGKSDFKNITKWVKAGNHSQVDDLVKQQNSDDLTQLCDCVALSLTEKDLLNYHSKSSEQSFSNLVLGVYYSHEAWRVRGRGLSGTVSNEQERQFTDLLVKAKEHLNLVNNHNQFGAEANSRLIRVNMGLEDFVAATENYKKSINADSNKLWAYIHYAEMIQPKWGGEYNIVEFYQSLPDNELIQRIIKLKLYHDGLSFEMNYFKPEMEYSEYEAELLAYFKELDSNGSMFRIPSIHKYIVYGYMFSLAGHFNEKSLSEKYWKLLENKLPLYPFGLQ